MKGYVGIFSRSGRLVAYSDDDHLVREVAGAIQKTLPVATEDPVGHELIEARRRALQRIVEMRPVENSLLESQKSVKKAELMLRDGLAKIIPHLPETASETEAMKAAMVATKAACDLIRQTLRPTKASPDGKVGTHRKTRRL
jgi:hypothetical protein